MTQSEIKELSTSFRKNLELASKEVASWDEEKVSDARTSMNVKPLASLYESGSSDEKDIVSCAV